jgi:hypothetical protein
MDETTLVLLIIVAIYWAFNIKKIYLFLVWSWLENGIVFNVGMYLFAAIFILGCIIGVADPQYGWIPQRALILYIVAFVIYRVIFGVRDREG